MLRTSSYIIYVDSPARADEVLLVHGYTGAYARVSGSVARYLRSREDGQSCAYTARTEPSPSTRASARREPALPPSVERYKAVLWKKTTQQRCLAGLTGAGQHTTGRRTATPGRIVQKISMNPHDCAFLAATLFCTSIRHELTIHGVRPTSRACRMQVGSAGCRLQ
jgi:hypothetical protein